MISHREEAVGGQLNERKIKNKNKIGIKVRLIGR